MVEMVPKHRWSLDACVGYARVHKLFRDDEMVCTKTLYNELEAGNLPLTVFEVPDVLKRRVSNEKSRVNKRPRGRSIEKRPP